MIKKIVLNYLTKKEINQIKMSKKEFVYFFSNCASEIQRHCSTDLSFGLVRNGTLETIFLVKKISFDADCLQFVAETIKIFFLISSFLDFFDSGIL